jgi:hypothetical protein
MEAAAGDDLAIDLDGNRPAGQPRLLEHRRERARRRQGLSRSIDDDRGGWGIQAAHGAPAPPRGLAMSSGSSSAITGLGVVDCWAAQGIP